MKVQAKPDKPVIGLSLGDKAIGNFVKIDVSQSPTSEAHSDLVGDVFYSMWKRDPHVLDEVKPDRLVNQAVMKWAMDNDDFQQTQEVTAGNLASSMVSTGVMWSMLSQDETIKDAIEKQRQAEQEEKKADELLKKAMDESRKHEPDSKKVDELMKESVNHRDKASQIAQEAADKIEAAAKNPIKKFAMSSAAKEAGDKAEEVQAQMTTWGIGPGDINDADDLAEIVNATKSANFSEISRILGRLRGVSRKVFAQAKTANHGAITKIGRTRDIARVLPEEIADLNVKAPRPLRLRKVIDLFSIGLIGHMPLQSQNQEGDFIAYVDRSGSMYGTPYRAAKSLVLGIGLASRDELGDNARSYQIHGFSGNLGPSVTSDDGWKEHLKWAANEASGGTSFDAVFNDAIERLKECKAESKPDVLLITDGECCADNSLLAEFHKLKTDMSIRLVIIVIGGGYVQDELLQVSDIILPFADGEDFANQVEELAEDISRLIANHHFE